MKLKFDLQFFGGGGGGSQQVRKRDPEPQELINLRNELYNQVLPGLQSFNPNSWKKAQETSNKALQQQNSLLEQIPSKLNRNDDILNKILTLTETGNIPNGITNRLNASVSNELQNSMGGMLNDLSQRGVLNSSVTTAGTNNLSQAVADAYNKNYLTAYNSVLNGYNSMLQGSQNDANSLLSTVNVLGGIPSQSYENAYAGLMPAFNMWKAWQNSYDSREDYDTIVKQGK